MSEKYNNKIAIIGMAGYYPNARNIYEFFDNLLLGKDCIGNCPEQRKKDIDEYLEALNIKNKEYRKAAYLNEIDKFDYKFFKISPRDAMLMDPHQRILLQVTYQSIEDSGYNTECLTGKKVGVFTGFPTETSAKSYQQMIIDTNRFLAEDSFSGNLVAILASRISYFLNLKGPSMVIDTSCSSSLSAVHIACNSLLCDDCEVAIVNGINIFTLPIQNSIVNSIGIISPDGKARPFDDSASGVGQGEGVGSVVLKPFNKAKEDNDHIYAVIISSSINQDGHSIGITAPNQKSQEDVIINTWKKGNINPETIKYIETHGTATKLGDPTEFSSISNAFKKFTSKKQICGIGSVKSNIGHTIGAAGITSLIKVALAMDKYYLPKTINFKKPNRRISFQNSSLYMQNKSLKLNKNTLIRCGINSFGISGTNCHVVLENSPPAFPFRNCYNNIFLFTLSAYSITSLLNLLKEYIFFLSRNINVNLNDLCATANCGRKDCCYRAAFVVENVSSLLEQIQLFISSGNVYKLKPITDFIDLKNFEINPENFFKNPYKMAKLYVDGYNFDWNMLYKKIKYNKISFPVYQFDLERCWFDISIDSIRNKKSSDCILTRKWVETTEVNKVQEEKENILYLSDDSALSNNIISLLRKSNNVYVAKKQCYQEMEKSNDVFYIEDNAKSYTEIWNLICNQSINKIIFSFSLNSSENFSLNNLYHLHYLIKLSQKERPSNIILVILVKKTFIINSNYKDINPINSIITGFSKSIKWEYPNINIKCIDIGDNVNEKCIIDEFMDNNYYLVSLQNCKRYIPIIEKIPSDKISTKSILTANNLNYLILGGNGRIGIRICNYIADNIKNANLFIIGRKQLPKKANWQRYCQNKKNEFYSIINKYIELENRGCNIYYYSVDISEEKNIKNVIQLIHKNFGNINGIFNCVVSDVNEKIDKLNKGKIKKSMLSKVYGTILVDKYTSKDKLDFFINFSSVMTLISGIGSSCYTASNSFLESYSDLRHYEGIPMYSISWPEWEGINLDDTLKNDEKISIFKKIKNKKAIDFLFNTTCNDFNNIFIGDINYESPIYDLYSMFPFQFSNDIITKQNIHNISNNDIIDNPIIIGRKNNVYSILEKEISNAFAYVLGYKEINIDANYFDLGGDSISAAKISSILNEKQINVSVSDILSFQTISNIAKEIDEK